MNNIVVYGATSAIAFQSLKLMAKSGVKFALAGNNLEKLNIIADDLRARGAEIKLLEAFDALDIQKHTSFARNAQNALKSIDLLFIAHGTLPDNELLRVNNIEANKHFAINCNSVISLITSFTSIFEKQNSGTISIISSVAGDRGRQSNFLYGSAKGALSLYLDGLRNYYKSRNMNIKVVNIKPGMVSTPMTADLPPSPLFANVETVAQGIVKAIKSGKEVAYIPGFWKIIMLIIRNIPRAVFDKLKL